MLEEKSSGSLQGSILRTVVPYFPTLRLLDRALRPKLSSSQQKVLCSRREKSTYPTIRYFTLRNHNYEIPCADIPDTQELVTLDPNVFGTGNGKGTRSKGAMSQYVGSNE